MKAFLANLEKYNEGILRGQWIDPAGMDDEDWEEALREIDVKEGQEYFIPDYDDDPLNLGLGEYEPLAHLTEVAEYCDEYGTDIVNAVSDMVSGWQEIMDTLDDNSYTVIYASNDEELGYEIVEQGYWGIEIPEALVNYIDYEAIGRDFAINVNGEYANIDRGTAFIFVG